MLIVDSALAAAEAANRPIRVGLVGAGFMGRGVAHQISVHTRGMRLVAIANRTLGKARDAARRPDGPEPVIAETPADLERADRQRAIAITADWSLVTRSPSIDVVVEVTGTIEYAAHVVIDAIEHGKHVVLMNAELDGTIGPVLRKRAAQAGVVCTNADGDQPGVIMNLYRFARQIGLRPVLCGNIKGLHDPYRTPATQAAFAARWGQSPRMVTSFADGTKIAFEQAIVANACGFGLLTPGMLGPTVPSGTRIQDAVASFPADVVVARAGTVDYVVGADPAPGVFVLALSDDNAQRSYLELYKLGPGPLYCLHTPFHLCHFEVPITVARAALFRDATIRPAGPLCVEVTATAKRDLPAGTVLDGIGGFDLYGRAEEARRAQALAMLPIGLAEGATLRRTVRQDESIGLRDVDLPPGRMIDRLRAEMAGLPPAEGLA